MAIKTHLAVSVDSLYVGKSCSSGGMFNPRRRHSSLHDFQRRLSTQCLTSFARFLPFSPFGRSALLARELGDFVSRALRHGDPALLSKMKSTRSPAVQRPAVLLTQSQYSISRIGFVAPFVLSGSPCSIGLTFQRDQTSCKRRGYGRL